MHWKSIQRSAFQEHKGCSDYDYDILGGVEYLCFECKANKEIIFENSDKPPEECHYLLEQLTNSYKNE